MLKHMRLKGKVVYGELEGDWLKFDANQIDAVAGDGIGLRVRSSGRNIFIVDPSTIQPAEDPRKQMLDEIREKINNLTEYKTFVRVEGDPVPTLPQIAKWCVIWILDEMEAKL